jgi:multiple antibiotic resistance protein
MEHFFIFNLEAFLSSFVAILALINPVQKIFIITSLQNSMSDKDLNMLSIKAGLTALVILVFFLLLGNLIFSFIFHIKLYAFRITCGFVMLYNGLIALQKGIMLQFDKKIKIQDIVAVPLAIPMIAGPGTITAAVTFPSQYGSFVTILAIVSALGVNLIIMLCAKFIGKILMKRNIITALVRILGLIIATIGVQMICDGFSEYLSLFVNIS